MKRSHGMPGSGIRTGKSDQILRSMKIGKAVPESAVPIGSGHGLTAAIRKTLESCTDGNFIPFTFESKEQLLFVQSAVMSGLRKKGFYPETRSEMSTFTLYIRLAKEEAKP